MENEFKKVMSERSNEELIAILTHKRKSYNPSAIQAAEAELSKRDVIIDESKIIENQEEVLEKQTSEILPSRKAFDKIYGELSDNEIQQEILFTHKLSLDKLERIRKNTSTLVWFIIIIPIILVFIGIIS
ncbi:MAG: hypothetical protein ACTIK4_07550 [Mesonia sp.]|uniref:hypothetical protein n=1 Tax=Mesonia sp. TaxID=1960830 RepID=UPI003F9817E2